MVCATPELKGKAVSVGVEPQETDARTAANADAALQTTICTLSMMTIEPSAVSICLAPARKEKRRA